MSSSSTSYFASQRTNSSTDPSSVPCHHPCSREPTFKNAGGCTEAIAAPFFQRIVTSCPARLLNDSSGSSTTSFPSFTIATRSHNSSTSLNVWLEKNTVCPAFTIVRRCDRKSSCTNGSSPLVGSSSTSNRGRCASAKIIPSFCLIPRDICRTRTLRSRSYSPANSRPAAFKSLPRTPPTIAKRRVPRSSTDTTADLLGCTQPPALDLRRLSRQQLSPKDPLAASDVGLRNPRSTRIVVVFPAPLGPRNPYSDPSGTDRFTPSTPRRAPYVLVRFATSTIAAMGQQ